MAAEPRSRLVQQEEKELLNGLPADLASSLLNYNFCDKHHPMLMEHVTIEARESKGLKLMTHPANFSATAKAQYLQVSATCKYASYTAIKTIRLKQGINYTIAHEEIQCCPSKL